jgi:pimeloyl-ACP methyl ester carboxylesterase
MQKIPVVMVRRLPEAAIHDSHPWDGSIRKKCMRRLLYMLFLVTTACASDDPPPGRFVDVGGRRLHLHCTGSGGPTVILEAGASSGFYSFWAMQPRLPFRACSYDRAGLGFSDSRPGRRVSSEIAEDLHTLMQRAGERPPFVLVGHSLGGLFVRKYAELYPNEVVGIVLLDSVHEDEESLRPPEVGAVWQPIRERIQAERAKTLEEGRRTGVWPGGPLPAFLPESLARRIIKQLKTEKWWQARNSEAEMYEREPAIPPENRRLDIPLVVFTATRWVKFDERITDEVWEKWMQSRIAMGAELASRSPRGEHIVLDVNHGIHWDAPDPVIDAIRRVARSPRK